ncbi:MAG: hypothetical protein R8J94_11810 [Acidimicrobiia bacterium]|nr:hypothetical protein [Acidimicrobiia bacterium]
MASIVGVLAIGLMVVVLAIAIASLLIVGTIPLGKLVERWRRSDPDD